MQVHHTSRSSGDIQSKDNSWLLEYSVRGLTEWSNYQNTEYSMRSWSDKIKILTNILDIADFMEIVITNNTYLWTRSSSLQGSLLNLETIK